MIQHVAIWVSDLEKMKDFYVKYFNGVPNNLYHNKSTGFKSYFLTFSDNSKLELMQMPSVSEEKGSEKQFLGLAHIAFSVGSVEKVNQLTDLLIKDGCKLISGPRTTGDGYFESCVLDPELNRIELTV